MCIIIIKPAGVEMPSDFTLYCCMRSNPDGFGFATPDRIYHSMSAREFNKQLHTIKVEDPCIIHCRIATHGSVKRSNCHPFYDPVSGVAFAHNGMLSIKPKGDMTDSETAFRRFYAPVIQEFGYKSRELAAIVRNTIGASRFAFMNDKGEIQMYGNWIKQEGCFFSHYVY